MAGAKAHSCPADVASVPAHCDQPQSSDSSYCAVLFGHSRCIGWRLGIRVWEGGTMVERRRKGVLSLMVKCCCTLACHCGQFLFCKRRLDALRVVIDGLRTVPQLHLTLVAAVSWTGVRNGNEVEVRMRRRAAAVFAICSEFECRALQILFLLVSFGLDWGAP